jgi:hypothetical protein
MELHLHFVVMKVDKLSDELKNDATLDTLDYIIFFKGFKSMEIESSLVI